MKTSTDAIIAYGFDLGEDRPEFLEGYEDFEDFIVAHTEIIEPQQPSHISPEAGSHWRAYREARRQAVESFPVELIIHCSNDYRMYFLAVRGTAIRAKRGTPIKLGVTFAPTKNEIRAMQEFCEKYGIEWQMPGWHLFSYWG
jgi:hypothetical protein